MLEKKYLTALYSFTRFGPARTRLLIDYFGSAKNTWKANTSELREVGLSQSIVDDFEIHRVRFDIRKYFQKLDKLSIKVITINDKDYPKNLIGLDDAPLVLYVKGEMSPDDANSVAIVGTRKMTPYGKKVVSSLATGLANHGVTIISGLALGIDAAAHWAAVNAGGRCIAVLASGLDKVTPVSNTNLARSIIRKGGAIVSESPLAAQIWPSSFVLRNRIISGMARAVVVIEGAKKSGTLLTASSAARQGKQVLAVPGPITSLMSAAPHFLLRAGAKMVTNVDDILEELDYQRRVEKKFRKSNS
jgi:DNA processing protein